MSIRRFALAALAGALFAGQVHAVELLNVSYDPTRELYQQYNAAFIKHWKAETGEDLTIKNSHGGSGKQARSVIDGLQADVVTLALSGDIDALNTHGQLIDPNWQQRLPDNSTPYTSTIVFLVRKGNPKHIKDWDDLVKKDVQVITPNPKTSGGARWNFLAAWAYAKAKYGSDAEALKFVTELYRHAPVLDTGARGATISFVQRQLGDVLIAWENEAYLALKEEGGDQLEIVTPSLSILAEPPVAWVDKVVERKGTLKQAKAYLEYLYSPEGQRIAAQNFYRPRDPKVAAEFKDQFKPVKLVTIEQEFGGWKSAQPKYFADGGVFDKIFTEINK
ncbi:sulfate ABC transporter substrate-binding protein [Pseudomonas oryzihabitans]|uniref:ABC transporter permease n=1 Tax=Pseudomonas oryzihabitans TaxID=47885 RepID=A0A4Y5W5B1_9PSED|nr:sulfate ABC transporter substrate-binding protein [Pseudomonas psychrotolerans]MDR6235340.1 sulfate/thiosulfate-binding protein [Pseudomonas psychrotolerans]MDR6355428.1 sulfate/thiosulfate-binding protein [Pseudomonas psychrotolerans]MDR6679001.1 sulfate transport system substrate-binding protein [Pseudomonas psychrotolerans]QDD89659.1 ABC transporter permease [Pseudomonas psychrotolerans]